MNKNSTRKEIFLKLYQEVFPSLARLVGKMGGSLDQAKDIFQDALIVYYEEVLSKRRTVQKDDQAYLFVTARNMWYHRLKTARHEVALDQELDISNSSIDEPELSSTRILDLISRTGQRCLDLLKSFYYNRLSMKEIAKEFGFAGERSATVQKYKCLEKVRETVKEKHLAYADFIEGN